jgi:peptidoglycan/xylan/chitin deacetylase (PgdA/CDA1 family)
VAGCPGTIKGIKTIQVANDDHLFLQPDAPIDFAYLPLMEPHGVYHQCRNPRHLALTFDDGILGEKTEKILDTLRSKGAKATFFLVGSTVASASQVKNRQLVKRIVHEGHDIGSHTQDHEILPFLDSDGVKRQVEETHRILLEVSELEEIIFFRAPGGQLSLNVLEILRKYYGHIIHWSHDSKDYVFGENGGTYSLDFAKEKIPRAGEEKGGPIVLYHDFPTSTVEQLGAIIKTLTDKGYKLVTMQECLGMS